MTGWDSFARFKQLLACWMNATLFWSWPRASSPPIPATLRFKGVALIGQAFADEVFRVFPLGHPEVELVSLHANQDVNHMIAHILGAKP